MVKINAIDFQFTIDADPDTLFLDEGFRTRFSIEVDSLSETAWFVEQEIQGLADQLILFFDSAAQYEVIVQKVQHTIGSINLGC